MKRVVAAIVMLFLPTLLLCSSIEVRHSEAASYLHFLKSAFGEAFTSGSMKNLIESKGIQIFKKRGMREKYEHFKSFLQNGYNFNDEIPNRPEGFWADDALMALAANSPTLSIFEKQLSLFVPYRGIASYYEIKKEAYPLFNHYVWNPTLRLHESEEVKLKETLKKTKFLAMLKKASVFYRSNYPEMLPFKVALIPIPDSAIKERHTSATSLRDVQIVPYLTSLGTSEIPDIVFHEFCHALYEGQSSKFKEEINDFYLNNSDSHSIFVYRYLNEALATAWGNGWYREVLDGSLSSKNWYAVNYIDQLAKAYLPLIKDYSTRNKSMDQAFMKRTIQIAKEIFPNAPRELSTNMIALRILTDSDDIDSNAFKTELQRRFRVQSIHMESPIKEKAIGQTKNRDMNTVFIITREKTKALRRLQDMIGLSTISEIKETRSDFLAIIPQTSEYLFWANVENRASFSKLLSKLDEIELLPTRATVLLN